MRLLSSFGRNLHDFAYPDELVCSVLLFSAHQPGTLFELNNVALPSSACKSVLNEQIMKGNDNSMIIVMHTMHLSLVPSYQVAVGTSVHCK